MSDAKYFQRGKIHDLRLELTSDRKDPKHSKKKVALKKIVANMTMGNDMSALFPDVIACMGIQMLDIKKMVYLYVMNYARARSDMAVLAVNSLSRDAEDPNPLIRALAIRTMGYINVDPIMTELLRPLHRCLSDKDPYVCKTAAITVVKLFMHNRQLVDSEGFLPELQALLNHDNSTVVANAVAALIEISSRSDDFNFELDVSQANKLLTALNESSEWGQAYLLDAITFCAPQSSQDAELLADRVLSRLQHANSAVVLTACRVIIYLTHYISNTEVVSGLVKKLAAPLVTLLHSQPEIQYISLRNILLLLNHTPTLLNKDLKVFFCKYNDPIYVKLSKLEILVRLADASNIGEILSELKEYASEVDVDFVRKSVRCVGRCAVRIEQGADRCVNALVELIRGGVSYVVQEAIVVIKDIFRKYPNRYESLLTVLCEALDTLDSPDAKASMIWIVGQYAERIDNAGELLSGFLEGFLDEPANVQLALLTAIVKLFIKRPSVGQDLVPRVLKYATEEVGSPDLRDRGYIYWRLLSTDPVAAKAIILSDKPAMQGDELMDPVLLEELLLNVGCLSSVWGKSERSFVGGVQPRGVRPSRALVFRQKGEMMPEEGMGETGAVYGNQFENELGMGGMMSTGGLNTGVMGGGLDGLGGDGAMGGLGDLLDLDMGEENMSMGMTMGMEGGADLSGVFGGMGGDTTTSGMNTSLSWAGNAGTMGAAAGGAGIGPGMNMGIGGATTTPSGVAGDYFGGANVMNVGNVASGSGMGMGMGPGTPNSFGFQPSPLSPGSGQGNPFAQPNLGMGSAGGYSAAPMMGQSQTPNSQPPGGAPNAYAGGSRGMGAATGSSMGGGARSGGGTMYPNASATPPTASTASGTGTPTPNPMAGISLSQRDALSVLDPFAKTSSSSTTTPPNTGAGLSSTATSSTTTTNSNPFAQSNTGALASGMKNLSISSPPTNPTLPMNAATSPTNTAMTSPVLPLPYTPSSALIISHNFSRSIASPGSQTHIFLHLHFTNPTPTAVSVSGLLFNKNALGLSPIPIAPTLVPAQQQQQQQQTPTVLSVGMLFDPNMIIPPPTQTATPSTSTGEIQVALKTSLGIFYARTTVPLHIVLFTPAGRVDPDTFLQSWGDASLNSHITTTTSGSNISSTGGDLEPALEKRNVFVVARRNVDTGVVVFVSVGVDGVGGGAGGGVGRVLAEVRFDPTQNVMVTVKAKMGVEMLKGIAEALAGIVRTL